VILFSTFDSLGPDAIATFIMLSELAQVFFVRFEYDIGVDDDLGS